MLCKYYWIALYTVHVTAFCLGGPFFSGHGVYRPIDLVYHGVLCLLPPPQKQISMLVMPAYVIYGMASNANPKPNPEP